MWALLLFASTGMLFLVPLLPALLELRLRRDALPLAINQEHTGHVRFFADAFHAYVRREQGREMPDSPHADASRTVARRSAPGEIVLPETSCLLPDHAQFDQEIFASNALGIGINSRLRAVLAKSHLVIRRDSVLLRWAHGKSVGIGDDCLLLGRLSADDKIVLRKGTRFTRLNAPCVAFGDTGSAPALMSRFRVPADWIAHQPLLADARPGDRRICNGDIELPEESLTLTDLVVRGALRIRRGAIVTGSVKSQGNLVLGRGVTITGALVSECNLIIGEGCRLGGPVVAERVIHIGSDVLVGAADHRATVTAPKIRIAEGTVVCGTVWARDHGRVLPRAGGRVSRALVAAWGLPALIVLAMLPLAQRGAQAVELAWPGYQAEDGAITVHYQGESVDPYFAAKALLAAQETGVDSGRAAAAWIDWALRHQRPTGAFDRYCRHGRAFVACAPTDADDSALALWIELLIRFAPAGGMPQTWRASLARANEQLQSLRDPRLGVYRISARQPVALLMDNIEVYSALRALAGYYEQSGDGGRALFWHKRATALRDGIQRVFRNADGSFRVSTQDQPTVAFYPDRVAQLFPLLADMALTDSARALRYSEWLAANRAEWFAMTEADYPWGLAAMAAHKAGDDNTVSCWRAHAAPFRYGKHWNVLEEAIFIGLAKGSANEASPPCLSPAP
jgi:cytoskeletal protein CcmA (bactofilin family)